VHDQDRSLDPPDARERVEAVGDHPDGRHMGRALSDLGDAGERRFGEGNSASPCAATRTPDLGLH
jgi:hypothetical protein